MNETESSQIKNKTGACEGHCRLRDVGEATRNVGESTRDVGELTVGETTRWRNDQIPINLYKPM